MNSSDTPAEAVVEWADWAGTNAHEILTGIGARVPWRHLLCETDGTE
ncbi:MAG TPA: hypothetical protein VF892_01805 [Pseudonocardiaceae bacterium]